MSTWILVYMFWGLSNSEPATNSISNFKTEQDCLNTGTNLQSLSIVNGTNYAQYYSFKCVEQKAEES